MLGRIELIVGPMFSGKSTELMRRLRRHSIAKKKVIAIKHKGDTRYSKESMSTHDKLLMPAISCTLLSDIKDTLVANDVIGIDEGQFFPDICSICEELANMGKDVIIACLDGTFQRKPFGSVLELLPMAEDVTKLSAICVKCGNDAHFTMRLGSNDQVVIIGGAELYLPVCRKCYFSTKL